ncbi:MAG: GAF domain-containing sensor histidine kinase [Nitrospirae bacterium]|nr:GAF domain-containing sensor histidine kinase [Nitrospirota bacterium]
MNHLLPKSHRILEKGSMAFQPFGKHPDGHNIQDVSGVTVRANVEFLEDLLARTKGPAAGTYAVQELIRRLNERIPNANYHVTQDFLRNPWNSYSYEFVIFLAEFCVVLSGDDDFHIKLGREKLLSPLVQILGKPFSISKIYSMFPHFAEKFGKGALKAEAVSSENGQAVLRLRLGENTAQQFGPYRYGSAERICQSGKNALAQIPSQMFHLESATISEPCCMADGADYCEWHITWKPHPSTFWRWPAIGILLSLTIFSWLTLSGNGLSFFMAAGLASIPTLLLSLTGMIWTDRQAIKNQQQVIREQLASVESQHEALRGSYLAQEQTNVDLRQKFREQTMFRDIALRLSSTLDQHAVIKVGLDAITRDLPYDRAMITRFDQTRQVAWQAQVKGVSEELATMAYSLEVPISNPTSFEGKLLLQGEPVLVNDINTIWTSLHPLNQKLVTAMNTQAFIAVPLKFQHSILGALVADRSTAVPLTHDDVSTLLTIAHHIALALHNAHAYADLQTLNQRLEAKVQERTFDLEQANRHLETTNVQLAELNNTKSEFLAHCSHELRTPLASIKGFSENLLSGLGGPLTDKQKSSLQRIQANSDRLARMIANLLDLSQIEAGKLHLHRSDCDLTTLVEDVVAHYHPLAQAKNQRIDIEGPGLPVSLFADTDHITQILLNLLHNASKLTPDGGAIRIVTELVAPDHTSISIIDSGPGIPEDAIPKLFDPFFQAHRDHEIGTKGLGLGLAIVQHLVTLHDGSIHVENHQPHGATFRVLLPQHTPPSPH